MDIDRSTGLLNQAKFVKSPNFDDRPDSDDIDLIVIHSISLPPGEYQNDYITQLFTNCLSPDEHPYFKDIYDKKVSAHVLIKRDGSIIQYAPFNKRAWHAGDSQYENREQCNDFSIGIELEGTDDTEYEELQYSALAETIRLLKATYHKISTQRITGHSEIASGRKTDPGAGFNWEKLHKLI